MKWLAKAWESKNVIWALIVIATAGMLGLMIASQNTNLPIYALEGQMTLPFLIVFCFRAVCLEAKKTYAEVAEEIGKIDPLGKLGLKLQLGSMFVAPLSCGASIFLTNTTVRLFFFIVSVLIAVFMGSHLGWLVARDIKKHFQRSRPEAPHTIETQNVQ